MRPRSTPLADILVHEAAHAVVAWELGLTIVHIRFSSGDRSGEIPFQGRMHEYDGVVSSDEAREAAECDLLVYHAGMVAQRLFHYETARSSAGPVDAAGIMSICRMVEEDTAVIDEWSEYIEERVRVMLSRPATWARVIALAPEIARRLYFPGEEVAAFLTNVDMTGAAFPKAPSGSHEQYAFARSIDALDLSHRASSLLAIAEIETVAELLLYSARDLRRMIPRAGAKSVGEIEGAVRALGLTLAEGERRARETLVQRARRELP